MIVDNARSFQNIEMFIYCVCNLETNFLEQLYYSF